MSYMIIEVPAEKIFTKGIEKTFSKRKDAEEYVKKICCIYKKINVQSHLRIIESAR
jgi:hypothetical protein